MKPSFLSRAGLLLLVLGSGLLGGCAMVAVRSVPPADYVGLKRGDILGTGELSANTHETLNVIGVAAQSCDATHTRCIEAVASAAGLSHERRLSALAELWLQQGLAFTPEPSATRPDPRLHAWLEAARHAYAYLFLTERGPNERAFEDRQIQMLDTYNYATQEAVGALFAFQRQQAATGVNAAGIARALAATGWRLQSDLSALPALPGASHVAGLVPASSLRFDGLRSTYRRDGFGAELVAVMAPHPRDAEAQLPFSPMTSPVVTAFLRFGGEDLNSVLATREVTLVAYNPYRDSRVELHGQDIPLAANFTAGYGLWLARAGFARQSILTLLGRREGIAEPHIYLMQPYDPSRRVILMIHGLASSPEAWVNLANEILGDDTLREHFQIWQVYYPTNVPVPVNRAAIAEAVRVTRDTLDPDASDAARCNMVVIGHSMGGLLTRLLLSSSNDILWQTLLQQRGLDESEAGELRAALDSLVHFSPLPGVDRAVFLAAPHQGTVVAGSRLVHWLNRLIALPLTLLEGVDVVLAKMAGQGSRGGLQPLRLATGVDHLDAAHPFVKAAAGLPMHAGLAYHSVIARADPAIALAESDDGLVPYWSAHLPDALSEAIITSGHSVQETPAAILEIRRILHHDLASRSAVSTCD
ncbi:MAG: alpha/beta hydrolase [Pigmentiphaga sp.]|nr:alpha/beta hydrolase [Pigmentiphaga sp.]